MITLGRVPREARPASPPSRNPTRGARLSDAQRAALSIIEQHGEDGFRAIVEAFQAGVSTGEVARRHGVDRRTAWAWRKALGTETRVYAVHPEIAAVAAESDLALVGDADG